MRDRREIDRGDDRDRREWNRNWVEAIKMMDNILPSPSLTAGKSLCPRWNGDSPLVSHWPVWTTKYERYRQNRHRNTQDVNTQSECLHNYRLTLHTAICPTAYTYEIIPRKPISDRAFSSAFETNRIFDQRTRAYKEINLEISNY